MQRRRARSVGYMVQRPRRNELTSVGPTGTRFWWEISDIVGDTRCLLAISANCPYFSAQGMRRVGDTHHLRIRQRVERDFNVVARQHASSLVNLGEDVRVDVRQLAQDADALRILPYEIHGRSVPPLTRPVGESFL